MYRSPKLLKACRDLPCAHCGTEDGTVVAAHSNQLAHGKGRGMKAPDYMVAALCFRCHTELDQGKDLSREERREYWDDAWQKTIATLFERGVLKV
jgi:hypothetical protein